MEEGFETVNRLSAPLGCAITWQDNVRDEKCHGDPDTYISQIFEQNIVLKDVLQMVQETFSSMSALQYVICSKYSLGKNIHNLGRFVGLFRAAAHASRRHTEGRKGVCCHHKSRSLILLYAAS